MKMMKKVLAALLACLIVMSMAACAAKSDQTAKPDTAQTDADQPVPNAEDTQTPNAEAGDAPVSNDEADLTSWILEPDTNMAGAVRFWIPFKGEQGMDAMIAAFNEVYPNITVELNPALKYPSVSDSVRTSTPQARRQFQIHRREDSVFFRRAQIWSDQRFWQDIHFSARILRDFAFLRRIC